MIAALSVIDSADHAVVRIVTSRSELTRRLLERHKLPFSETDILVVELSEKHSLSDVCHVLLAAELSVHYVYPLSVRPGAPQICSTLWHSSCWGWPDRTED